MVTQEKFRTVMGHFATGVTILASRDAKGDPVGLTVNAFTSVSLDPPLVLVCIHKEAEAHDAILEAGHFGLSFLRRGDADLAVTFATADPEERFEGLETFEGPGGSPLIPGALAWVDCRVQEVYPGGDHSVILGRVVGCEASHGDPLLFFQGSLEFRAMAEGQQP